MKDELIPLQELAYQGKKRQVWGCQDGKEMWTRYLEREREVAALRREEREEIEKGRQEGRYHKGKERRERYQDVEKGGKGVKRGKKEEGEERRGRGQGVSEEGKIGRAGKNEKR